MVDAGKGAAYSTVEGLPVTRVQPGAVIGAPRTGESTLFFGFADPVKDLFHGRTVDYVADFIARIANRGDAAESEDVLIDDSPFRRARRTTYGVLLSTAAFWCQNG